MKTIHAIYMKKEVKIIHDFSKNITHRAFMGKEIQNLIGYIMKNIFLILKMMLNFQ